MYLSVFLLLIVLGCAAVACNAHTPHPVAPFMPSPQVSDWERRICTVLHLCLLQWLGGTHAASYAKQLEGVAEGGDDRAWYTAVLRACQHTLLEGVAERVCGARVADTDAPAWSVCAFEEPVDADTAAPVIDFATKCFSMLSRALKRPSAVKGLVPEYRLLVAAGLLEVNEVVRALIRDHVRPPVPGGFPSTAGKVSWAMSLQKRVEAAVHPVSCAVSVVVTVGGRRCLFTFFLSRCVPVCEYGLLLPCRSLSKPPRFPPALWTSCCSSCASARRLPSVCCNVTAQRW